MAARWHSSKPDQPAEKTAPAPSAPAPAPTVQTVLALQASAGNQAVARALAGTDSVKDAAAAAGDPLPHRATLESAFGTDLGGVRADAGSPRTARALAASQAHAVALPDRVLFDRPDPGLDVVAHEVTHVIQQRKGGSAAPAAAEREAGTVSSAAVRGERVAVREGAAAGVAQFLSWQPGTTPPVIKHDHGFLDDGKGNIDPSKKREATAGDYASLAKWRAMLYGAQVLKDMPDATRAYEHFLDGKGADLTINYEKFVNEDPAGVSVLASAIEDVKEGARIKDNEWLVANPGKPVADHSFDITSDSIPVSMGSLRYPYPKTENWQKAIGAHPVWIKAHVDVHVDDATSQRTFKITMTLNAEDRYNFNPGAKDIATGTKDAENGAFEATGLGHEYMQYGSVTRNVTLTEPLTTPTGTATPAEVGGAPRSPDRTMRHDREGGET